MDHNIWTIIYGPYIICIYDLHDYAAYDILISITLESYLNFIHKTFFSRILIYRQTTALDAGIPDGEVVQ